jgi:dTDP-glucose 4,6-dehydratase
MVIFIDIDKTICYIPDGPGSSENNPDYSLAVPIRENIEKANKLYDQGHEITYWTARGSKTGEQWFHTTIHQLQSWGCKFHELRMGKPHYDMFICDKTKRIEEI